MHLKNPIKNIMLLTLGTLVSSVSFAQNYDYTWMWGYNSELPAGMDISLMSFKDGKRTLISTDEPILPIDQVNMTFSDAQGNLLFYSNGCDVANANHEIIENGDSINFSAGYDLVDGCTRLGYTGPQNTMVLPDPGQENGYYLLHKRTDIITLPDGGMTFDLRGHFYSYIDMNENDGLGKVLVKNQRFLDDTIMSSYSHAVKHVNGSDWWMIDLGNSVTKTGSMRNDYIISLLDSNGIEVSHTQQFGPTFTNNSSDCGSAKFSAQGDRWAYHCIRDGLILLDFDRSTGILSNYRRWDSPHVLSGGGLEWSANGRFLYISTLDSLFQYDTWEDDVMSTGQLVEVWDGWLNPFQTVFGMMQRGPDCRIYMNSRSTVKSMHVINEPDEPYPYCNFSQHGLDLFHLMGTISIPTYPNYRLDTDPVCDPGIVTSVTETEPDEEELSIKIYPNPTTDRINVYYEGEGLRAEIMDLSGKVYWQGRYEDGMAFNVQNYPRGTYVVRLVDARTREQVEVDRFLKH